MIVYVFIMLVFAYFQNFGRFRMDVSILPYLKNNPEHEKMFQPQDSPERGGAKLPAGNSPWDFGMPNFKGGVRIQARGVRSLKGNTQNYKRNPASGGNLLRGNNQNLRNSASWKLINHFDCPEILFLHPGRKRFICTTFLGILQGARTPAEP